MPFTSRFSRRRRFRRRPTYRSRRKPFFNKQLRMRQGLARHTFWCVGTGGIRVDSLVGPPPTTMIGTVNWNLGINNVIQNTTFNQYASIYSEWRCLKMIIQFYPSYVGSETTRNNQYIRGNTCTYVDTPPVSIGELPPGSMNQILRNTSAIVIDPRRYGHKRWINRPRTGYDEWGKIERGQGGGFAITPDSWTTEIKMYGDGYANDVYPPPSATNPQPQPPPVEQLQKYNVFFFKVMWKIQYRSRYGE